MNTIISSTVNNDLLELTDPLIADLLSLDQMVQALRDFANAPDFLTQMQLAFGDSFDPEIALSLGYDWSKGDIALPSIEIVSTATLNGAYGGYASETNTIYLSEELLNENPASIVADVIVEEFGHHLDTILNESDTPGDEGEIFAALVQGIALPDIELQTLQQENDFATIFIDGQEIQIEEGRVSDSGGFEGSFQTITLDTNGGGFASFRYEHFRIPDNFIIRYEGQNILETGFTGGSQTGTVQIPEGDSNQLEILVATDNAGTAWNYDVETFAPGLNIQDAYIDVAEGSNQTATIKFPVTLSEAFDVEVSVNYFTLVGTAVDGVTGNDRRDYRPITGTLTFAPGQTSKEIEVTVFGDTPVNHGGDKNFEIFARDTAYRNWQEGQDIDLNSSLSYGDLGYRVDQFFDGPNDFQAAGLTSDENFFVLISDPVNAAISKDSDEEKDRLLMDLEEFLGGETSSSAYQKALETVNDLQAQDVSWTFGTGTIYDLGKAPVLAIRGTASGQDAWDDANPSGIGYAQFTGSRGALNQWLQEVSEPEDTSISFKPHITGHSLGGALTQWVAADYSSQGALGEIVTFNSPGISVSGANSFAGAEQVTHHITSTDVVSMAGFRYIAGQYILYNETFSTFNQVPVVGVHTHPVILNSLDRTGATKPGNLSKTTFGSVNSLNSPLFTYLPDPDYFVFLLAVSKIPLLGPPVAVALRYRGTAELARTAIGGVLYTLVNDFNLEYAKAAVQAAWEASKQWASDAWDAVKQWGEAAWDAVGNWTTAAWNATTEWVSNAWEATKQWTSDAWEATKEWTSDAWDATTEWTSDAWEATKQWTSDAWDATTEWTSDAWNATTEWTSDAWNATTEWTASAWEATTEWLGSFLPFSSNLLAVAAFETTEINLQQTQISNPWEATTYWTPEAWAATTQWTDAAWEATTQWTIEIWQETTEWTDAAWEATKQWTDDIWQATTLLDSVAGDEIIFGTTGNDNLSGQSGDDIIDGGDGDDIIDGGDGNDIIDGGDGNDIVTGGSGSDSFVFDSPTEGVDTIEDFDSSEGDRLVVSAEGFGGGLTPNAVLEESQFVVGTEALDSDDRFIYDPTTGNLFFDPDGTGDASQQLIATLTGAPSLSVADIFISGSATTPTIKITAPITDISGTEVTIEWNAFDADSEATISLYYDTDNQGFDGVLIVDGLAETDGSDSFIWNTENVPQEDYFIYAVIDDGTHSPVFNYGKGQVQLKPVEEADLSVSQTANLTSVSIGETLTYTIEVTNNGTMTSQGVTLVETLPETVTFVSASLTPAEETDNTFTFEIGDLEAGESQTIEISVIAPNFADIITASAAVTSETTDPNTSNDIANLSTEVTPPDLPDLAVTRTNGSGTVNLRDPYSYTLTVTNNGSAEATEVVLTERLPSSVDVINATASTPGLERNLVDIIEFQLDAGERVILDIDARILDSSLDSVLRLFNSAGTQLAVSDDNSAPGEPDTFDSYIDFTASVSDTYYVGVSGYSNFSYNPLVDGTGASSSSSGSYELTIQVGGGGSLNQVVLDEPNNTIPEAVDSGLSSANPGTLIATGLIRTDTNPITISNGVVTANLGNLDIGESATVDLTLSSIAAGNLTSTTNVTSNEPDANPLNNLITGKQSVSSIIPTEIDLELSQTVSNANPAIGDQITLSLTLTNRGPGTATSIEVRDILPSDLEFLSASTLQGTYNSNTGVWDVGNMRDNLSRTLTITARVNGGQSLTNTAEVIAVFEADVDSTPNNNDPNEDDQASIILDIQNEDPIAQIDKTLTVLEDATPTSLGISAPTDANGDSLTLTVNTVPEPTKGEVRYGDGITPVSAGSLLSESQLTSLLFVPVANANGSAGTFSYSVNDGQGGLVSQTITLEITPVNDAPVAVDDTATTSENTPLILEATSLLANDEDIEQDELIITGVGNSTNGQVTLDNDGNVIFTPDPNFTGEATFDYTISDGNNGTNTGTVTVTVTPDAQPTEIMGTTGVDDLVGTSGNDIITGLLGADILTGNGGNDIFVYESYRDRTDTITDFETDDRIDLSEIFASAAYGSITPYESYVQLVQVGANTNLQINPVGDSRNIFRTLAVLENVTATDLNASHFIV
ncbi:MAG: Ig-like domain-containing protein [Crocosphaera sp.]